MTLGFGMNGMEDRILQIARDVSGAFNEITYIEIGVGEGTTLSAIAFILKASKKKWRAIGIELANGYSFNRVRTEEIAKQRNLPLNFVVPNCSIVHPKWDVMTVYFLDSQRFLTEHWQEPIHFALIDGCHGKPCVTGDFLALEAFMVPGGTMMFHDFNPAQRGYHQPHCPSGVDVWGACQDLGLLTGKRKGWKFTEHIHAQPEQGGWDMGIFTKEAQHA